MKYMKTKHADTNLPPNTSIQGQNEQRKHKESQSHTLLPANTVNSQKDDHNT